MGKKATHKYTIAKDCLFGPEIFQNTVPKSDNVDCHRQLNGGSLYKQSRRNPLDGNVCSPVESH